MQHVGGNMTNQAKVSSDHDVLMSMKPNVLESAPHLRCRVSPGSLTGWHKADAVSNIPLGVKVKADDWHLK